MMNYKETVTYEKAHKNQFFLVQNEIFEKDIRLNKIYTCKKSLFVLSLFRHWTKGETGLWN